MYLSAGPETGDPAKHGHPVDPVPIVENLEDLVEQVVPAALVGLAQVDAHKNHVLFHVPPYRFLAM